MFPIAWFILTLVASEARPSAGGRDRIRLHGWNAFIAFSDCKVSLCTVPKVGCSSMRQWVLELAPDQLRRCTEEMEKNNTARLLDPACRSLQSYRNLTSFKRAGMTKFKSACRHRHMDPSEFLLGKERCMATTPQFSIVRAVSPQSRGNTVYATFVRHPIDRFISWFVDKALFADSNHRLRHLPRFFDTKSMDLLPGYGISKVIYDFWKIQNKFKSCNIGLDEHYATQTCICRHDVLLYDFVGRLENLSRDWPAFTSMLISRAADGLANNSSLALHRGLRREVNARGSDMKAKHVRGNLTVKDIDRLYEIYEDDFIKFNYTVEEWWGKQRGREA